MHRNTVLQVFSSVCLVQENLCVDVSPHWISLAYLSSLLGVDVFVTGLYTYIEFQIWNRLSEARIQLQVSLKNCWAFITETLIRHFWTYVSKHLQELNATGRNIGRDSNGALKGDASSYRVLPSVYMTLANTTFAPFNVFPGPSYLLYVILINWKSK